MSKGKQSFDTKINTEAKSLFDISESIIPDDKRIFIPDANNKPPISKTVISFSGSKFLTTGNLSSIISRAGVGKSSILEALISNYLNPECDGLGFSVNLSGYRKKILLIDGERTVSDTWNSWERIMKRANKELEENVPLIVANFKSIGVEKRIQYVTDILNKNNDIGLVILDGGGDFIVDTNSIAATTEFKDWIYTFNPQISTLVTIHTNPDTNKPRGTVGSELWRISEGVVLARKISDNDTVREITTNFDYGKVRNDLDAKNHYYEWCEDEEMFMSSDYESNGKGKKEPKQRDVDFINSIFENQQSQSFTNLAEKYKEFAKCSENTAKTYLKRNIIPLLQKRDGAYFKKGTF